MCEHLRPSPPVPPLPEPYCFLTFPPFGQPAGLMIHLTMVGQSHEARRGKNANKVLHDIRINDDEPVLCDYHPGHCPCPEPQVCPRCGPSRNQGPASACGGAGCLGSVPTRTSGRQDQHPCE